MSFKRGNTQMGDAGRAAKRTIETPKIAAKAPHLVPARALDPELPAYPERARKLNIHGFVMLEAEIDARGKLLDARVRQGLERGLDELALASLKRKPRRMRAPKP